MRKGSIMDSGAADTINYIIHLLGVILYDPVYYLYDLLPFSDKISAWRLEYTATFFDAYLKPIFIGFCVNLAVEGVFGAAFGTIFNLVGDIAVMIHFFDNVGVGLVHIGKGVLGFPVYILASIGPYILPPIITIYTLFMIFGGICGAFSKQGDK